jgi:paraquat-inducible protein B
MRPGFERVGAAAAIVVLATASVACRGGGARHGGAGVHVLFDERHGLEGGEPVRLHDFDVGEVASVDLADSRVRANLSIDRDVLAQLTRETTASVESNGSKRFLLLHVLDTKAEKIAEGATLEGVDSGLELTLRQAQTGASHLMDRLSALEWQKEANDLVSEMEGRLDEADLGSRKDEVQKQLGDAKRELEKATEGSADEAKKTIATIEEQLKRLATELEKLGRSDDAKKLRERIEKLDEDLRGSHEQ